MVSSETIRWTLIGAAISASVTFVLFCLFMAYKVRSAKSLRTVRPQRGDVEIELSGTLKKGPCDLEKGVFHDRNRRLPDPDMFMIPEEEEGGKSKPPAPGPSNHTTTTKKKNNYPMPSVQARENAKMVGLELGRDVDKANPRNRDDLRSGQGGRTVKRGNLKPVMGGAILIHGDSDDETLLIPAGAPLTRRKSKHESKGKGKAREVDEDSSYSEPFDLSHFLSPRTGLRAPDEAHASVGFDHALPAVPKPAMTKEPRGRSISGRPVHPGSPTISGPSGMPSPSRFMIVDTDVSSEEEKDANRWKPEPPKVSRYRGLSATRPGQKPCAPSPPPPLPRFPDNTDHVTAHRLSADFRASLPAPETFVDLDDKRDSWEYFPSVSDSGSGSGADDDDSDEWTSEVLSTVVGVRPDDTTTTTMTSLQTTNTSSMEAAGKSQKADPEADPETETGKETPGRGTGEKYPAWEHGGSTVPDSRILTQNASLPGRKAKFVEVDVDGSPGATSNVFRDCLELLREGARSPTIVTDLGYYETQRPAMTRGKTWGMSSGALFNNMWRRDRDGDAGEGPSRPQVARSKTSQA